MLEAAYIWMAVFAASALVFFAIAVVVAWKGFEDLKNLLIHSSDKDT